MLILFCMTLSRWNLNLASFEKVGHGVMWIFAYGEGSLLVTQFGFMERKNIGRILVSRGRAHLWKLRQQEIFYSRVSMIQCLLL